MAIRRLVSPDSRKGLTRRALEGHLFLIGCATRGQILLA